MSVFYKYSSLADYLSTEDFYLPASHISRLARKAPTRLPDDSGSAAERPRVIVRCMDRRPGYLCVTTLDNLPMLRGTQGPRAPQRGCFEVENEVN